MGFLGAVLLFAALILFYVLLENVFTVLFRMMGLTQEKARFQVVSLLTNSGFTTRESELITVSQRRRNLARFIMLFGYAFSVTIVSSVVNIFLSIKFTNFDHILLTLPWLVLIVLMLIALRRSARIRTRFDALIERAADRHMFRRDENHMILLDEYGAMVIAQVHIAVMPQELRGKRVADTGLRKHNILLMSCSRKMGRKQPIAWMAARV